MDPLKQIARAWEGLAEGWRHLLDSSSGALTHFIGTGRKRSDANGAPDFPQWGLLAAETWETDGTIIVRLEVPGMTLGDLDVSIHGANLRIRGEKRADGEHRDNVYHLMERAYGRFERSIALPGHIGTAPPEVSCRDGILTVILAKAERIPPRPRSL
jgi:HSP20 family protein